MMWREDSPRWQRGGVSQAAGNSLVWQKIIHKIMHKPWVYSLLFFFLLLRPSPTFPRRATPTPTPRFQLLLLMLPLSPAFVHMEFDQKAGALTRRNSFPNSSQLVGLFAFSGSCTRTPFFVECFFTERRWHHVWL